MRILTMKSKIMQIFFHPVFILCFATAFSILYQGYYFGENDGSFYIPYLKSLTDNSLFPHDLLISTWKAVYFANLWKILAFFTHFFQTEPLLLVLHILFRFLFFVAIYLISLEIFKNKKIAYLSVILWFIPKPSLGFGILYNEFVQSEVALTFLLFSVLFFLKNKYFFSFIILALMFHIHPPMAGFMFICYFLYLLYKKDLGNIIKLLLINFALGFPIIINALIMTKNSSGFGKEWVDLTRMRSPDHSFPFSWKANIWLPFALFLALFLIGFKNTYGKLSKNKTVNKVYFLIFVLSLIIFAGFLFAEVIVVPKIIMMVPFHISGIFTILATMVMFYWVYELIINERLKNRILGYLLFVFLFFNNFDFQLHRSEITVGGLFILSYLVFSIVIHSRKISKTFSLHMITFLLLILVLWIQPMIKTNLNRVDHYKDSWVDVQKWSKNNTNRDAMFLVPIYLTGFRVYSERPIVGDWKDGVGGYLSPKYSEEWWSRMKDFGLSMARHDDSYQKVLYNNLSKKNISLLSKKYHAQYFVTENKSISFFPKQYQNKYFAVYSLSSLNSTQ